MNLKEISIGQMREAAKVWRQADRKFLAMFGNESTHDRIDDLINEIERLRPQRGGYDAFV